MANTTIPQLPVAITLDGTEQLEIVQPPGSAAGVSKRATTQQIANLARASGVSLPIDLASAGSVTGVLPVGNGGLGTSTLTANGVLLGNGTSAVLSVAPGTATYVLTANGTGSAPTFQPAGGLGTQPGLSVLGVTGNATAAPAAISGTTNQVLRVAPNGTALTFGQLNLSSTSAITGSLSATAYLTGIVSVPLGGTGTTALTGSSVLVGNGTAAVSVIANATSGYVLTSTGPNSPPTFQAAATGTGGLTPIAGPSVLGVSGTASATPGAVTGTQDQVLRVGSDGTTLAFGQVNLGTSAAVTSRLSFANVQTTAGLSVLGVAGAASAALSGIAGTTNQVLVVNPGGTGLAFGQVNLSAAAAVTGALASSSISGIIAVSFGGTGTSALTANGVVLGNGTASVNIATAGSAGQIFVGQTTLPSFQTMTGDLTLNSAGSAVIAANAVTFTKFQQMQGLSVHGNGSSATTNSTAIVGAANQALLVNAAGTGLAFGLIPVSASLTGVVPVLNGGTGTSTLAANGVVLGNGTSTVNIATAGTAGQIFVGQSTLPSFQTMTGDLTLNSAGSAVIAANAVTYPKFQQMVALSVHANTSSATQNSTAVAGTTNQVLRVDPSGTALSFGQVNLSAAAAITGSLTSSNIATSAFMMLATTGQAYSGGVTLTSLSLGTAAATTTTLIAGNPPLQRIIINGTASFVAPSAECEIDILVTNAASASTISFSGFSVGSNTGDTYTTTSGSKFILMSRTINGSSTYAWKALQ